MTANRWRRPAFDDRELRLWKVGRALTVTFITAVMVASGVFYGLVHLLDFQEIDSTAKLDAKTLFELVKLSFGVVAGAGALVALVVAYRRQRVDEAGAHREATRLHTERFSQAIDKLGSDSPAVRLGGVHALAGLAEDAPDLYLSQTCLDVLCAYLQLPFAPDPGDAAEEGHHRYLALRKIRHTILQLISDRYYNYSRNHLPWHLHSIDLTGVVIDCNMDFTGVVFPNVTPMSFNGAKFSGGTVSFSGATFSSSSNVSFIGAEFSGGEVSFAGAHFIGFDGEGLPAGAVSFNGAKFSGGTVSFVGATFSGGTVSFVGAEFSGGTVLFNGAKFVEGPEDLPTGAVSFDGAKFSGSTVDFFRAKFDGGEVSFIGAEFSSGTTRFDGATGSVPNGLIAAVGTPPPESVRLPIAWLAANP
ncbi:pentapeptide repeat-containing protein [Streptomyces viridosporus]|uniref:pentapeptide repeat-containing protein n=1 Tax=Streptomyces viridosporus TaxID=67581 RepID=UPI0009C185A8|nr:pentapeptide repeat-containing protein [Streptomyces viridosporus]